MAKGSVSQVFSDADFADELTDADFVDSPALNPLQSATQTASVEPPASLAYSLVPRPDPVIDEEVARGFLGQPPVEGGFKYKAGRVGLPTALSVAGQALGGGVGPVAAFGAGAGAGLGTALQSGARALAARRGTPGVTGPTLGQAIGDVGTSAATNAAFAFGGGLLAKGAAALKPAAVRVGAQILKAGPAIPEKYGAAALGNLEKLSSAMSHGSVSEAYEAFERYTGLKSLGAQIVSRGESYGPKELERIVIGTANRVAAGKNIMPQELYTASQAASKLKQFAKYGEPQAKSVVEAGIIDQSKGLVDDALGKIYPEYQNLRGDYFWSNVADEFSSPLPLNKNQTPNVLRTWGAGAAAMQGLLSGSPFGLLAPIAISPAAYGLALRGAYRGAQAAAPLAPLGRAALATSISDSYRRQPSPAR